MSDLMKSIATASAAGGGGATVGNFLKGLLGGGGGSGGYTASDIAAANAVRNNLVGTSTQAPADFLASLDSSSGTSTTTDFSSYMGDYAAPADSSTDFTLGP